ncbi:TPA: DUF2281 domain-containing protein [Candidatus Poribacteria bacterium]|nr:DUF2281 domain-containing protein [Candidatus Poribacteria bacterium]
MNIEQTKTRILEAINELSPEDLAELQLFLDFLQFKEQPKAFEKSSQNIVKLEGLWKDLPFDITDDDIRQVRREFTLSLQKRREKL